MALVNAIGLFTLSGLPTDGETITIGTRVYTWRPTVSTTANEVKIGATAIISISNLIAAINRTGTPGTQYGSLTTPNPFVRAKPTVDGDYFIAEALVPGEIGNAITVSEVSVEGGWDTANLYNGAGSIVDEVQRILTMQPNASVAQALLELNHDQTTV